MQINRVWVGIRTIPLMELFFKNIPHFSCRLTIDDNGSKILWDWAEDPRGDDVIVAKLCLMNRFTNMRHWNRTIDRAKFIFCFERNDHCNKPNVVIAFTKQWMQYKNNVRIKSMMKISGRWDYFQEKRG